MRQLPFTIGGKGSREIIGSTSTGSGSSSMAAIWAMVSPGRGGGDDGDENEREEDRRLGVDVASPLLPREGHDACEKEDALERGDLAVHEEPLLGPVSRHLDDDDDGDDDVATNRTSVNSFRQESLEQLRLAVPASVTRVLVYVSRITSVVFVGQLLPVEKLASAALANSLMVRELPPSPFNLVGVSRWVEASEETVGSSLCCRCCCRTTLTEMPWLML